MKSLILILFTFYNLQAGAQNKIGQLIQAEKDFAAYSVANNTRAAFLKYLDSTGVVFENGKAVNGIEAWNKKDVRPGVLNWHPQFAEISGSGNLGYTTGPWTFQQKTTTDSIIARGQYATVWQLDNMGNWKFIVDLGVNGLPSTDMKEVLEINAPRISSSPIDLKSMVMAEEAFISQFNKDKFSAYNHYLSEHAILNRNGYLPTTNANDQKNSITDTPGELMFKPDHSGISTSGDLGFVYGSSSIKDKTENYLRVWRKEKKGWKIAMEVVRY
jgi:ketosteroid isomerase-like protein